MQWVSCRHKSTTRNKKHTSSTDFGHSHHELDQPQVRSEVDSLAAIFLSLQLLQQQAGQAQLQGSPFAVGTAHALVSPTLGSWVALQGRPALQCLPYLRQELPYTFHVTALWSQLQGCPRLCTAGPAQLGQDMTRSSKLTQQPLSQLVQPTLTLTDFTTALQKEEVPLLPFPLCVVQTTNTATDSCGAESATDRSRILT